MGRGKMAINDSLKEYKAAGGDVTTFGFSMDELINRGIILPRVVTASRDKTAKIWDANTGTILKTLTSHTGWVFSAAFN